MSKERIVKEQAREAMKGNTLPIIAGIAVVSLIIVMLENAMYLSWIIFDAVDLENEKMNAGSELPYFLSIACTVTAGVLLSPFFNGMFKTASNAVINGNCEITDLFYFFGGMRRYLKTLLLNMALYLIYGGVTTSVGRLLTSIFGKGGFFGVIAVIASGIISFLAYALFVHYPLCLYAVDDSRGVLRYAFGCIGFSFRHFWAFIKLTFSMLGWILLCFFVVPIIYVGPYALCAAVNSARWLKNSDDERKSRRYPEQQINTGYKYNTGDY